MQKTFWNIYKTFFKIGALLLGGGYVILPLLQSEISEKKCWTTMDEIVEYYALSQSLPGVIAANISIFIGHKLLGIRGAVAAITGIITPAFLAIILIANILEELVGKHTVQSVFSSVAVGVVILVILTIKEMWSRSITDTFTKIIFITTLILALIKVPPAWLIIGSILIGILYGTKNPEEAE